MRRSAVFLLAVAAAFSCAAPREEAEGTVGTVSSAVEGTPSPHSYAVAICSGPNPSACAFRCSGALIAPNLVIAARHCVALAPATRIDCTTDKFGGAITTPGSYWVTTNRDVQTVEGGWHQVREFKFPDASYFCGGDLVLLFLKDNVPIHEATPAEPSILAPLNDRTRFSTTITAIGHGETGGGAGDPGRRNIKQSILMTCLPGDPALECPQLVGKIIDEREFVTAGGACTGDSGSGAFEQTAFNAGKPLMVGVLSRGDEEQGKCVRDVYVRLDRWAGFIAEGGKRAAKLGAYPEPPWTSVARLPADPENPFPPGTLGASCSTSSDCQSNLCVSGNDGRDWVCSQHCDPKNAASCAANFECRATADASDAFCLYAPAKGGGADPAPPSKGCSVAGPVGVARPPGSFWAIAALVACACAWRRRRCA